MPVNTNGNTCDTPSAKLDSHVAFKQHHVKLKKVADHS